MIEEGGLGRTIGFVFDSRERLGHEDPLNPDISLELDSEETLDGIETALVTGGYRVERIDGARALLERLQAGDGWSIVFNIAEGLAGRNRESQVPLLLEMFGVPYVGSDALTMGMTLEKAIAKTVAARWGVRTPGWVETTDEDDPRLDDLAFPVIVKCSHEGSSMGLTSTSIAHDSEETRREIRRIVERYREPALVEEFVSGFDLTVVVLGNQGSRRFPVQALPPIMTLLADGQPLTGERVIPVEDLDAGEYGMACPAPLDEETTHQVRRMAETAYRALGLADFGRVDIRLDDLGVPYFLEINPLPYLGEGDAFPTVADAIGVSYGDLVRKIVDIALDRHGLR